MPRIMSDLATRYVEIPVLMSLSVQCNILHGKITCGVCLRTCLRARARVFVVEYLENAEGPDRDLVQMDNQ